MIVKKTTGVALAVAAAGLFSLAPMSAAMAGEGHHDGHEKMSSSGKVHCYGVNKCKGYNDCKSASNSCKGKSSCKGKGFVSISQEACDKVGGKKGA